MGTATNAEDLVALVRAAVTPGATSEQRAQAAELLRTLLALVEPAPPPATAPTTAPPPPLDPLTAILERLWPLVESESYSVAARLGIPFIPFRR